MVSNLFSTCLDDSKSPSAEVVLSGHHGPVREYLAGPENALLAHVIATHFSNQADYPILLFGPTGVGKSHLIRGMVDRLQTARPDARSRLLNGPDFYRLFSQAHEVGSLADVRQQLQDLDCFALDDVQSLADKPQAQLELLNLLDKLRDRHASVIVTSRVAPHELDLSPHLKSRLSGGLTVPVHAPSPATRAAFVRRFSQELELDLPADVVDLMAGITPVSIPELRGLLLQIQQFQRDGRGAIDVPSVSRMIHQRANADAPGVREIIKKVARYFGLTVAELTGPSRRQTTVLARDTAIFLTRRLRKDSFEQIGTYFGGRDHSTVMHAFQKISKRRDDVLVNAAIVELAQRLGMQHRNI